MSKSTKIYGLAALILVAFPLVLAFWSGASAIMAILLIGVGAYGFAVCLVIASFWHRHRYGSWPIEIEEDPTTAAQKYPYSAEAAPESARLDGQAESGDGRGSGIRYRANNAVQGWLRRFSSNV
jgi:hypothetical protein